MFLNERKIKILDAIIKDYIATAEPIGSRTIAKKFDFGVSSATIRNEMSDLEEMGFIIQPHLSSGRVPSDKGYRFYVDRLMHHNELSDEHTEFLRSMILTNINQINYLMKESAKAIAFLTNYTTIISEPQTTKTKIKHLQLVPIDEVSCLLILVTDSKVIRQSVITLETKLSHKELSEISETLSFEISRTCYDEMDEKFIEKIRVRLGKYEHIVKPVVYAVVNTMISESNIEVYTSGVKNLLEFPEFSDLEKARALFNALEEKQNLISLISHAEGENFQIVIGEENTISAIKDCSVIRANYSLGGQTYGNIGIIGPTRMDYPKVISVLKGIVNQINSLIKNDNINKGQGG